MAPVRREYARDVGQIGEDDDDPVRWLWVDSAGSRRTRATTTWSGSGWTSMTLTSLIGWPTRSPAAEPSVGFKNCLSERPELITRWHAFSGGGQRGRARRWLAAEGYTPVLRHG